MLNLPKKILVLALFILSVTAIGCSSAPEASPYGDIPIPTGNYSESLKTWTQSANGYSGGREAFSATATVLTPEITEMQVYRDARALNWTPEQYKDARDKALYNNETQTTCFVSFYTPEDDQNDLDTSHSIWNVFMDLGGRRLTPTSIKRTYEIRDSLEKKYPYVNVWARSYYMTFAVPAREAAAGNPELTITGTLGGAHLKFPRQ